MNSSLPETANSRLDLRPPGGKFFVLVYGTTLAFFVVVAIFNLVHFDSVSRLAKVLSVVWLAMVGGGICLAVCCEGGWQGLWSELRGTFSNRHWLEIFEDRAGNLTVATGFIAGQKRIERWRFPAASVRSVEWDRGQGSVNSGCDQADWQVRICYHQEGASRWTPAGQREESTHFLGQPGTRSDISHFGSVVVGYFSDNGIPLKPTENDCVFKLPGNHVVSNA